LPESFAYLKMFRQKIVIRNFAKRKSKNILIHCKITGPKFYFWSTRNIKFQLIESKALKISSVRTEPGMLVS